jgi:hypothetical protein
MNRGAMFLHGLTDAAFEALRELPIDLHALAPKVLAELEAYRLIELRDGGKAGRLTLEGARYVLGLHVAEQMARVCAVCRAPFSDHGGPPPHDNPEAGCRAFTYGDPELKPRS